MRIGGGVKIWVEGAKKRSRRIVMIERKRGATMVYPKEKGNSVQAVQGVLGELGRCERERVGENEGREEGLWGG